MSTASTPVVESIDNLIWVRNEGGQPRVRWRRVVAFVLTVTIVNAISSALVNWYANTPFRPAMVLAVGSGLYGFLAIAVELQRQRVLTGKWRFRLSLTTCLLLMLIAGVFFALMGNELRASQRGHAANLQMKAELESIIGDGHAYVGSLDGSRITCSVARPDFSDADLDKMIAVASKRRGGPGKLTSLYLDKTSVTAVGVQQLSACRHLTFLSLPSVVLSDEAVSAITACKGLEYLLLDEKKLTPAQAARLRAELPRVRLNGKMAK